MRESADYPSPRLSVPPRSDEPCEAEVARYALRGTLTAAAVESLPDTRNLLASVLSVGSRRSSSVRSRHRERCCRSPATLQRQTVLSSASQYGARELPWELVPVLAPRW